MSIKQSSRKVRTLKPGNILFLVEGHFEEKVLNKVKGVLRSKSVLVQCARSSGDRPPQQWIDELKTNHHGYTYIWVGDYDNPGNFNHVREHFDTKLMSVKQFENLILHLFGHNTMDELFNDLCRKDATENSVVMGCKKNCDKCDKPYKKRQKQYDIIVKKMKIPDMFHDKKGTFSLKYENDDDLNSILTGDKENWGSDVHEYLSKLFTKVGMN